MRADAGRLLPQGEKGEKPTIEEGTIIVAACSGTTSACEDDKPNRRQLKTSPIGYFPIDLAEVRTEQDKLYLFVGVDGTREAESGADRLPLRAADSSGGALQDGL